MRTYQVDPAYYASTPNFSALADAIMDVGPSPCMKFDCERKSKCAEEGVECKAFRYWVNEGVFTTYRKKLKREISIEHEMQKLLKPIK